MDAVMTNTGHDPKAGKIYVTFKTLGDMRTITYSRCHDPTVSLDAQLSALLRNAKRSINASGIGIRQPM